MGKVHQRIWSTFASEVVGVVIVVFVIVAVNIVVAAVVAAVVPTIRCADWHNDGIVNFAI